MFTWYANSVVKKLVTLQGEIARNLPCHIVEQRWLPFIDFFFRHFTSLSHNSSQESQGRYYEPYFIGGEDGEMQNL